jgi:hypothetical protein
MALQPLVGPWPLLQFRNLFYTVGRTPWKRDQLVARSLPTHRTTQYIIHAHNSDIHALSGIRTRDPKVRENEDNSCLDCVATVIGSKLVTDILLSSFRFQINLFPCMPILMVQYSYRIRYGTDPEGPGSIPGATRFSEK